MAKKISNKSRYEELIKNISEYFEKEFNIKLNSGLDVKKLFGLKRVLNNVNNMLTYKTTLAFIEWLEKTDLISHQDKIEVEEKIDGTSPNTNGFDVLIENPKKIVAEVKCNIPINNSTSFGVAQRNGIIRDMKDKLLKQTDYLKFMVLLNNEKVKFAFCEDKNFQDILKKNCLKKNENYAIVDKNTKFDNFSTIYVVFADL